MALEITQIKLMSADAADTASTAQGPGVQTTPSQALGKPPLPGQPWLVTQGLIPSQIPAQSISEPWLLSGREQLPSEWMPSSSLRQLPPPAVPTPE